MFFVAIYGLWKSHTKIIGFLDLAQFLIVSRRWLAVSSSRLAVIEARRVNLNLHTLVNRSTD